VRVFGLSSGFRAAYHSDANVWKVGAKGADGGSGLWSSGRQMPASTHAKTWRNSASARFLVHPSSSFPSVT
jgi:hypothetical protein